MRLDVGFAGSLLCTQPRRWLLRLNSLVTRLLMSALLLSGWWLPTGLSPWLAQAQTMELVESYPLETDLDQPDLRQTQEVWLEMIRGAKTEILWQTFYVAHEPGRASEPVMRALIEAAHRGVNVRLLVDGTFRARYPESLDELDAVNGIEVRSSSVGPWLGGVMHAKALFVDGKHGFVGSPNFDWRSLEHIRELGIYFDSSRLCRPYRDVFLWEWEHAGESSPPSQLSTASSLPVALGEALAQPTFSPNLLNGPDMVSDEGALLKLLDEATSSIEIGLLSYSPLDHHGKEYDPTLDLALRRAAVRGVRVRMLLGHWVEKGGDFDHLVSLDALDNVEIRVLRIPLAKEGEIPFARVHHSKYLVCDRSRTWLGTANWQSDYFHKSRNYGLTIFGGSIPTRLAQLFDFDWQRATALRRSRAD